MSSRPSFAKISLTSDSSARGVSATRSSAWCDNSRVCFARHAFNRLYSSEPETWGQPLSIMMALPRRVSRSSRHSISGLDARKEGHLPILPMDRLKSFISEHGVKLAILTVPGTSAQVVTNALVEAGIQAILNFSTIILQVPNNVVVNNVNLAIELENLSYFIT